MLRQRPTTSSRRISCLVLLVLLLVLSSSILFVVGVVGEEEQVSQKSSSSSVVTTEEVPEAEKDEDKKPIIISSSSSSSTSASKTTTTTAAEHAEGEQQQQPTSLQKKDDQQHIDDVVTKDHEEDHEDDLLLVKETIEAGRGHRDEKGERDQWSSTAHLNEKFDSRRPPSSKILDLLKRYQLDCKGCDHDEAVQKVNTFVQQLKLDLKQAQQEEQAAKARQNRIWNFIQNAITLLIVILLGMAFYYQQELQEFFMAKLDEQSGGFSMATVREDVTGKNLKLKEIIEAQREKAAKAAEERAKQEEAIPPNWREIEEAEIWTTRQEKQFTKALKAYGGIPPKARYTLIANSVQGKTKNQCLMHHKLIQTKAKETEKEKSEGSDTKGKKGEQGGGGGGKAEEEKIK